MAPAGEERYELWNYILAEAYLLSDSSDGIVQLTVTPRMLARALDDAGEGGVSPEDAEADFTAAVAAVYASKVLASPKKLRALKSSKPGDVPYATSFLALSVLAAFHMRTDDEHTGRAFYPRLAEMLGCNLSRSYPEGFDGDAFLELWEELDGWLASQYARRLAAPDSALVRRYVAYPFAHVPLRQVDIERLPQFFDAFGYEPGARAPIDRLAYDLFDGSGPWRYLTASGQAALRDSGRRPFVIRQVAHELERWDGCRTDSSGARTASIELWMDIRRRRAQVHLLARRPTGFPEVVENGELVFESSQEGWYEPIPLGRDDGQILSEGLRVGTTWEHERFFLQLRGAEAVPLTPSEEYTGFVSDCVLRADTECAVLCTEAVADDVARFLASLGNGSVYPRQDDTIPQGWRLFVGARPSNSAAPPPGLERLRVESSITLVPEGGLRLGRRWTWLEGAPARVIVVGAHREHVPKIDGIETTVDEDGRLDAKALEGRGEHIIEIGNRLRQRVTVLPGAVHPDCTEWIRSSETRPPVAVPAGHWYLVGAAPGDCIAASAPQEGALVRPAFTVVWAVQVGAGPGATAIHMHDPPPPEGTPVPVDSSRRLGCRWEEAIYQAGIRRPRLLCGFDCSREQLLAEWRVTMERARAHKRQLRRRRQ